MNSKRVFVAILSIAGFISVSAVAEDTGLQVDNGISLSQSGGNSPSEPIVLTGFSNTTNNVNRNDGNHTSTADESRAAQETINPAVDGRNIQPVSNAIANAGVSDELTSSRQDIVVVPGVNTLIPIAIGQLNRIVTPFERPTIQRLKLDNVTVNVQGNVVYVSTNNDAPVALYISEKGDESVAMSLSLVPKRIAPVQATLFVSRKTNNSQFINASVGNGETAMGYAPNDAKARKWEEKDSYVETIRNILRTIALGDIPPGYALGSLSNGVSIPNCNFHTGSDQDYIRYSFGGGQYIQGSQFSVIIGVAQNTGSSTVTVDESLCTHPNLAARALWSRNTLAPGQKTEAYFVVRNRQPESQANDSMRPKLAE